MKPDARLTPAVLAALTVLTLAAGCTPGQSPSPTPSCAPDLKAWIGQPLDKFVACKGGDGTLLVQDASPRVGMTPSYDGTPGKNGQWRIVNACSDAPDWLGAKTVEVAVIPVDHAVGDADFSDAVVCEFPQ